MPLNEFLRKNFRVLWKGALWWGGVALLLIGALWFLGHLRNYVSRTYRDFFDLLGEIAGWCGLWVPVWVAAIFRRLISIMLLPLNVWTNINIKESYINIVVIPIPIFVTYACLGIPPYFIKN